MSGREHTRAGERERATAQAPAREPLNTAGHTRDEALEAAMKRILRQMETERLRALVESELSGRSDLSSFASKAAAAADSFQIASIVREWADEKGDGRTRHFASKLIGEASGGRPPKRDQKYLEEIARLVAAGKTETVAIAVVGRQVSQAERIAPNSAMKRLREKYRQQQKDGRNGFPPHT